MAVGNREETSEAPSTRPKRVRGEPKFYISFMPEGRGGPREDKGSVPLDIDVEAHIEERTDCEPGWYRIEKKRSGEFSGEVLFYQKEDQDAADDAAALGNFADADVGEPRDLRKLVASAVSATLEARDRRDRAPDPMEQFKQMRELLKEERAEMQRQMSEQAGTSADPLAMFERLVELQKKLQPEVTQNPESEISVKDRAQLMLVKDSGLIPQFMRSMKELLHAPEDAVEPRGMFEQVLDFLNGWTPYLGPVLAPTVGNKLSEVVKRVNVDAIADRINMHPGVAPTANTQALPESSDTPGQPSSEMMTVEADLQGTISVIVDCITLDTDDSDGQEHLDCAVEAVRGFMQRNPMAQPILASMFARASSSLILEISQLRPEWAYVAKLGNASRFISDLKDALSDDDSESDTALLSDAATSGAKSNGANHGAKVES